MKLPKDSWISSIFTWVCESEPPGIRDKIDRAQGGGAVWMTFGMSFLLSIPMCLFTLVIRDLGSLERATLQPPSIHPFGFSLQTPIRPALFSSCPTPLALESCVVVRSTCSRWSIYIIVLCLESRVKKF